MTSSQQQQEFIQRILIAFPTQVFQHQKMFMLDELPFLVRSNSSKNLKAMTQALKHLEVLKKNVSPEISIELWVSDTILQPKVTDFISWLNNTYYEKVVRVQIENFFFFYNPGVQDGYAVFSFFDVRNKRAIFWTENEESIPWYEVAAPFRVIFHWFFQLHDYHLLHAACIGLENIGVLIVGKGGKGKTSTALTIFQTPNLVYVSDDYTLVKLIPSPVAFCLYSSAKVTPTTFERFPELQKYGNPTHMNKVHEQKETLFLFPNRKRKIVNKLLLAGIILPEIAYVQQTVWVRSGMAEALLSLAPSTIFQLLPENTHQNSFNVLATLVKQLPAFHLNLGSDPAEIGVALEKLIISIEKKFQ